MLRQLPSSLRRRTCINSVISQKQLIGIANPLRLFRSSFIVQNPNEKKNPVQPIEKLLEKDFPLSNTSAQPKQTLSSLFKSPFLKREDERNTYMGPFREMVSVSLKEVPTSALALAFLASFPLILGTSSFYFSSLPAYVLFGYQLNYASILIVLLGASHLSFEFSNFVNLEKFKAFLHAQQISTSKFDPTKQLPSIDAEKELEARKSTHATTRIILTLLPAMVGFVCLSLPIVKASLLLSVAFPILAYYDAVMTSRGLAPNWFPSFKVPVTIAIVSTILVSLFFYLIYGAMQQFEEDNKNQVEELENMRKRGGSREQVDFLEMAKAKKERVKEIAQQKEKFTTEAGASNK